MTATIAIVGRPNVGKSTLYNRLVGGRPALVHDTPGLTRDRRYGECDYFGRVLKVIDTGGLDPAAESDVIGAGIHRQAWRGVAEADLVVLVVDGTAGVTPLDSAVVTSLRKTGKPIVLAANKIDSPKRDPLVADLYALGLGEPFPISAAHGRGVDAMLEAICDKLAVEVTPPEPEEDPFDAAFFGEEPAPEDTAADEDEADDVDGDVDDAHDGDPEAEDVALVDDEDEDEGDDDEADEDGAVDADDDGAIAARGVRHPRPDLAAADAAEAERAAGPRGRGNPRADDVTRALRVAFIGKPNAGKSSLANRLIGEERSLVHHVAGTTTDPVDSPFSLGGRDYVLVDTAGIRRRSRVDEDIERIAVSMALSQIERADVCVLVIDATLGPTEQDARLAGAIADAGRGLVIALNKSDLVRGTEAEAKLRQQVKDNFHWLSWAPVTALSATRGDGTDRLMDTVDKVAAQYRRRISTAELNRFFAEVCEVMPPPIFRGKAVSVHYLTQGGVRPPSFVLFASAPQGLSPSYRRFLINQLRKRYGFRGTPLRIFVKDKTKDERAIARAALKPRPPKRWKRTNADR